MYMKKKKLHCSNCGTTIQEDEKACSVCRIVVERPETPEEEEDFEIKTQIPFGKIIMVILIFVGIVLTVKGFVEFQSVDACTADDCGIKSLFIAGLGIILIISASVALARDNVKYKIKNK